MKAATYVSAGNLQLLDQPKPVIKNPTDAIVRVLKTTICGTDLHILGGDVPACKEGTILGHEGIGIVEEVGDAVNNFKVGDRSSSLVSQLVIPATTVNVVCLLTVKMVVGFWVT